MATNTSYLGLTKPAQSDLYNIDVFNGNADAVDTNAQKTAANLATIEAVATASKPYAVGEYLVLNGILYKVTQAIANGGALVVGTNIAQDNVGTELKAIKDALSPSEVTAAAGSGVTINAQRIYKIGRLAICEFDITTTSSLSTNSDILTGCPSAISTWEFFGEKTADGSTHPFYVNSSGYIRTSGALPSGTWIASVAYVTYS